MEPNASTTSQGFDFSELPIKRVKVANELATKEAHQKIRMAANLASLNGAKMMLKRGYKEQLIFKVGDFVTVKIPEQDRHKIDLRRLPGVVVQVKKFKNGNFYIIRTKYGVLDVALRADVLQRFVGEFDIPVAGWGSVPKLPIRTAAMAMSHSLKPASRCHCKANCSTLRCLCKKRGVICTASCHSGKSCENNHVMNKNTEQLNCQSLAVHDSDSSETSFEMLDDLTVPEEIRHCVDQIVNEYQLDELNMNEFLVPVKNKKQNNDDGHIEKRKICKE
ncbi:uncharacterized protein LOC141909138 [Tubulanus polymorphus]|uniref:uncharacterized protein LOC141909138 n=1 Tax=Tubulanus polymorphus TaxID=672921 RepID=UPI003DA609AB